MSKEITALCDKIIELDEKRTKGTLVFCSNQETVAVKNSTSLDIIGKIQASTNDRAYMAFSVESASKLAKALKVTIYSLEEIKYSPVAERMLKEIEEIFK